MYILPWLILGNPQEFPGGQWLGLNAFIAMAWVQSLVGELRSCKSQSAAKKKQTINSQSCPIAQGVKNPAVMQETQEMRVRSQGQEDPLEKEMVTYSSIIA